MLKELIENDYGPDYNCAERILNGANEVYEMGLDKEATQLFAGFGGGLAIGSTCGALCGAMGVISHLFVEDIAHKSEQLKPISKEFLEKFNERMGSIDCKTLKEKYYNDQIACKYIITVAAQLLDELIAKYDEQRVR